MTARLDGEQKGGNPLLPDTQGGGLHYDRSHRKLTKDGFESAAHLTAYAQKSIMVVVGKRRLPSSYSISREAGGDHEVAVYLFRLGSTPGCRLVDIAVCNLESGNGFDSPHDFPRHGGIVFIDDTDGYVLHLSVSEDSGHEEDTEQWQHDAHPEIETSRDHPYKFSSKNPNKLTIHHTILKIVHYQLSIVNSTNTDIPGRSPSTFLTGRACTSNVRRS